MCVVNRNVFYATTSVLSSNTSGGGPPLRRNPRAGGTRDGGQKGCSAADTLGEGMGMGDEDARPTAIASNSKTMSSTDLGGSVSLVSLLSLLSLGGTSLWNISKGQRPSETVGCDGFGSGSGSDRGASSGRD